jgi:HEAT repeat protein
MDIDFKDITWIQFQDLCLDILDAEGFRIIRRGGIGPDRGADILVQKEIEYGPGCSKPFIWLVQCKHKTTGESLKPGDIGEFVSDLSRHNANGYWLMTNANLSTGLEDKLNSLNNSVTNSYNATYSNGKNFGDFLRKYRDIRLKYFPNGKATPKNQLNWKSVNPFRELQAFTEVDKDFFFGREEETKQLLENIYRHKIVGLFGESGTGKTSLIHAGLVPILRSEGFVVVSLRCLDDPIKRIREALIDALRKAHFSSTSIESLMIADSFPRLIVELNSLVENEKISLVIIVDQMEEIFTRAAERERDQLSKGIAEALTQSNKNGRISFLLALREDYIGSLWDWSHTYSLEDAWVHSYRIARLTEDIAEKCIISPLNQIGVEPNKKFVDSLISGLKKIGDGLIYPPYLQILCSNVFAKYQHENLRSKRNTPFDNSLFKDGVQIEAIIADYLSESMLEGLTEIEKKHAENILDVLTGPQGLRSFLNLEEISRYISSDAETTSHVLEHLTRKKIVHVVVENDLVVGHELVHDFLSKQFFERLSPDNKLAKATVDLFRKAFKEWKDHEVLASKDRLDKLISNFAHLNLSDEELFFLVKSSFSVYWFDEGGNKLLAVINNQKLAAICKKLLSDNQIRIVQEAIRTLGRIEKEKATPIFKDLMDSRDTHANIKETAVDQFWWHIADINIVPTLKHLAKNDPHYKIRKSATYALGKNIAVLSNMGLVNEDQEIDLLFEILNDNRAPVRKQVVDVLSYQIINKRSVSPLIERLKIESSISTRKSIVTALGILLRRGQEMDTIVSNFKVLVEAENEDYRVKEEARVALEWAKSFN